MVSLRIYDLRFSINDLRGVSNLKSQVVNRNSSIINSFQTSFPLIGVYFLLTQQTCHVEAIVACGRLLNVNQLFLKEGIGNTKGAFTMNAENKWWSRSYCGGIQATVPLGEVRLGQCDLPKLKNRHAQVGLHYFLSGQLTGHFCNDLKHHDSVAGVTGQ